MFGFRPARSSLVHGLFSSCRGEGLLSRCRVQASHGGGFSCWIAWVLGVHGHQELWWVGLAAPYGTFQARDWICVSCVGSGIFTNWATREAPFIRSFFNPLRHCFYISFCLGMILGSRCITGVGDGQGGLASCGSWGCKESFQHYLEYFKSGYDSLVNNCLIKFCRNSHQNFWEPNMCLLTVFFQVCS